MNKKLIVVGILLLVLAISVNQKEYKKELFTPTDTLRLDLSNSISNSRVVYSQYWEGQTFTSSYPPYVLTGIKLTLEVEGNPGDLIVGLRKTSNSRPISEDLVSTIIDTSALSPGINIIDIDLPDYQLDSGILYGIVARAPSGTATDLVNIYYNDALYSGGDIVSSTTSGGSWVRRVQTYIFEAWGDNALCVCSSGACCDGCYFLPYWVQPNGYVDQYVCDGSTSQYEDYRCYGNSSTDINIVVSDQTVCPSECSGGYCVYSYSNFIVSKNDYLNGATSFTTFRIDANSWIEAV